MGPLSDADVLAMNLRGPNGAGDRLNDLVSGFYGRRPIWKNPAPKGAVAIVASPTSAEGVTLTGPFGLPDYARNIELTASAATTGDAVVHGKDAAGDPVSETFTDVGTTAAVGKVAFASITSVDLPPDAANPTFSAVYGDALGIGTPIIRPGTVLLALKDGVEVGLPTINNDAAHLAANTAVFAGLDGTGEYVLYILAESS
jgi:hypothetical protein